MTFNVKFIIENNEFTCFAPRALDLHRGPTTMNLCIENVEVCIRNDECLHVR